MREVKAMKGLLRTENDIALTIARLVLGIIFFAHGSQKLLGWFGGYGLHATMDAFTHQLGIPVVFAFPAIMAEFLGGIGLILGFLTRISAFGIACVMLVAVMMIHLQFGFFMNWAGTQKGEGIEYQLLALVITIVLMIRGGGALSVDGAISGSTSAAHA
jgi:putative oxidoreductase